jgi:hypothetical protein
MLNRAEILKQQFNQSVGLPWQDILPASRIEEILGQENVEYRNSVYTTIVTLWSLISQVLDPDKSLSNAVKRIRTWVGAAGGKARPQILERIVKRVND